MNYWRILTTLLVVVLATIQVSSAQSPYGSEKPGVGARPDLQFQPPAQPPARFDPADASQYRYPTAAPQQQQPTAYPTAPSYQAAPVHPHAGTAPVMHPAQGAYGQQLPQSAPGTSISSVKWPTVPQQGNPIPTYAPPAYGPPGPPAQTYGPVVPTGFVQNQSAAIGNPRQIQLTNASMQEPIQAATVNPEGRYTINELIALAEQNNPILRRSLEKIESARGDVVQASLYPNPRFETNNPEIFAGRQSAINFGYQQDIVVKGKIRLSRDVANQVVEQTKANFRNERFNLLTLVRRQAFVCMASERRVEVLLELARIAAGTRDAAIKLEKAGEGSQTDVLFLATEFERADVSYLGAIAISEGDHKELAAMLGLPDLVIKDVVGDITAESPTFDEEYLKYFVTTGHALVSAANAEMRRTTTQVRRDEVEAYPNPRMGPHFQQGVTPGTAQGWFTIAFNIPIWDRNQGNIRQARAEARGAMANRSAVQNELLRQAADALSRYRAAKQVADRIKTTILPNAIRTQQLVRDGYARRVVDVTRLLQSQRLLTDTQINYIDASERLWLNAAEIAGLMQLETFP